MRGCSAWKPVLALATCACLLMSASAPAAWTPVFAPFTAYETMAGDPMAVAVGDVTGDGRTDVLVTTQGYADDRPDDRLLVYAQPRRGWLRPPRARRTHGRYTDAAGRPPRRPG